MRGLSADAVQSVDCCALGPGGRGRRCGRWRCSRGSGRIFSRARGHRPCNDEGDQSREPHEYLRAGHHRYIVTVPVTRAAKESRSAIVTMIMDGWNSGWIVAWGTWCRVARRDSSGARARARSTQARTSRSVPCPFTTLQARAPLRFGDCDGPSAHPRRGGQTAWPTLDIPALDTMGTLVVAGMVTRNDRNGHVSVHRHPATPRRAHPDRSHAALR